MAGMGRPFLLALFTPARAGLFPGSLLPIGRPGPGRPSLRSLYHGHGRTLTSIAKCYFLLDQCLVAGTGMAWLLDVSLRVDCIHSALALIVQ